MLRNAVQSRVLTIWISSQNSSGGVAGAEVPALLDHPALLIGLDPDVDTCWFVAVGWPDGDGGLVDGGWKEGRLAGDRRAEGRWKIGGKVGGWRMVSGRGCEKEEERQLSEESGQVLCGGGGRRHGVGHAMGVSKSRRCCCRRGRAVRRVTDGRGSGRTQPRHKISCGPERNIQIFQSRN